MTAHRVRIGHEGACLTLSDQHDGTSTRSSKGELWSVHVLLDVPRLQAETQVWLSNMEPSLAAFIAELGEEWRGWDDLREWATYEGGLALACLHDGLATLRFLSTSVSTRVDSGGA